MARQISSVDCSAIRGSSSSRQVLMASVAWASMLPCRSRRARRTDAVPLSFVSDAWSSLGFRVHVQAGVKRSRVHDRSKLRSSALPGSRAGGGRARRACREQCQGIAECSGQGDRRKESEFGRVSARLRQQCRCTFCKVSRQYGSLYSFEMLDCEKDDEPLRAGASFRGWSSGRRIHGRLYSPGAMATLRLRANQHQRDSESGRTNCARRSCPERLGSPRA
jgi:hypothetical protein